MALPNLPVPNFPDVPSVPGVPPVLRDPSAAVESSISELTSDQVQGSIDTPAVWGIFDQSGLEILQPDSVLGIRYRDASRIVDYPLEQGSFESYNKVANPFDVAVSISIGGSLERREGFLRDLKFWKDSLDLLNVVTPEYTFQNCNIEAYDYRRTSQDGVSLIKIEIYFREVRTQAVAAYSKPDSTDPSTPPNYEPEQSEGAAEPVSQGQVSPVEATPPQISTTAPNPPPLPEGYTKDPATGVIRGPDGKVDRDLMVQSGQDQAATYNPKTGKYEY